MTPHFFCISDITNSSSFNGKIFKKKSILENFRANVLKAYLRLKYDFKLTRFVYEVIRHSRDTINVFLTSSSRSILQVTDPRFFSLRFMSRTLRAWAINQWGNKSVRNLQYGYSVRLVRSIYNWGFLFHEQLNKIKRPIKLRYKLLLISRLNINETVSMQIAASHDVD